MLIEVLDLVDVSLAYNDDMNFKAHRVILIFSSCDKYGI
jgi:hypothetical protein